MTEPSHAVFLSYASQDAQAAQRICQALRAAGIEVWFDQSELRGGDAWDQKIRREIRDCTLFIPVISANTASRHEGYFRLEWTLADQRTYMIARNHAFIVPVCLDATSEITADTPESFQRVQWTRLPGGDTPPAFVEHVRRLLAPADPHASAPRHEATHLLSAATPPARALTSAPSPKRRLPLMAAVTLVGAVLLGVVVYLGMEKPWISKPSMSGSTMAVHAAPAPAAFAPPPHSIAVLPFVNLSGDKDQEYFSEGLTEEILNSLTDVQGLQVSGRTSAFSFQGTSTDLGTIARKLDVAVILEGSVRRSGRTVRITAQLFDAVTGYEVWSRSYDRDLSDVLKLQTDIATAVADALKVRLLGDVFAKIELGGTRNPAALDAYLRAVQAAQSTGDPAKALPTAIHELTEAIRLDPNYALAFAGRSSALAFYGSTVATGTAIREDFKKAEADARRAVALAPGLAEAHLALAGVLQAGALDFAQANEEYERALALAPGDAEVLRDSGAFAGFIGHFDTAIAAARRAVTLDPLAFQGREGLASALYSARRYREAAAAYADALSLNPEQEALYGNRGFALLGLGDLQGARASCETKPDFWVNQWCLAVVYEKLGRHTESQAELTKLKAEGGDAAAYQYAAIYAQWGDPAKALDWLDTAMRLHDSGLIQLKTDPLMDPLRQEPRFQAILRELHFPSD